MRSEFEFIQNIKSKFSLTKIGDDCAVMPKDDETDLLVTTDMLVEDIDFRLDWTTPEFLGHKALAVSLSDIAAIGGKPVWSMLSIAVPDDLWNSDFVDRFYKGWFTLARKFNIELVGGDVSSIDSKFVIDSIVGGEVTKGKAILRSTAKPGDAIFVTGTLGGATGGLKLLESGSRYDQFTNQIGADLLLKQLRPQPQITIANSLHKLNIVTSMIDISDGLSSDLKHLCDSSNVGAKICAENLPVHPKLNLHFPADECLDMALNGGEDFELLFTIREENISLVESLDVTLIGEITTNIGVIELITDNQIKSISPKGFRHF